MNGTRLPKFKGLLCKFLFFQLIAVLLVASLMWYRFPFTSDRKVLYPQNTTSKKKITPEKNGSHWSVFTYSNHSGLNDAENLYDTKDSHFPSRLVTATENIFHTSRKRGHFSKGDRNDTFTSPSVQTKRENTSNIYSTTRSSKNFTAVTTTTVEPPLTDDKESNKSRDEVRHIAFLKVHKAASSTMQNMFYRFGLKRNLTFVFTDDLNYFSRAWFAHYPVILPKNRDNETIHDILCNHGIFSSATYSKFIHNDSVYLAIVREPLQQFISAVHYYSQRKMLLKRMRDVPGTDRVRTLIRHTSRYDSRLLSHTRNSMSRDFGFDVLYLNDTNDMIEYLYELESIFELVLIVEHFDECLILMKRYLNWSLRDIIYLPNNVIGKSGIGISSDNLTDSEIDMFKKRNFIDYMLYDFFLKKFWGKVAEEPPDFYDEVSYFKTVLLLVRDFCESRNNQTFKKSNTFLRVELSRWNDEFIVSKQDCKYMRTNEIKFNKLLRRKQGSELPTKSPSIQNKTKVKTLSSATQMNAPQKSVKLKVVKNKEPADEEERPES